MSSKYEFEKASRSAADIFNEVQIQLSPIAIDLLRPELSPGEYLQVLVERELSSDAIGFLAYALPTRYAVWWGCLVLAGVNEAESLSEGERSALRATIAWVVEPNEDRRVAAEDWSGLAPAKSPYRWLARAAGFKPLPLPAPKYSRPQDFQARGVRMAIEMAEAYDQVATQGKNEAGWVRFVAIGLDVSRGENLWPQARQKPSNP